MMRPYRTGTAVVTFRRWSATSAAEIRECRRVPVLGDIPSGPQGCLAQQFPATLATPAAFLAELQERMDKGEIRKVGGLRLA